MMPISWGQLPSEMREAIVLKMDARSRVNLSMCSKSDNQLVRGIKYGETHGIILSRKDFKVKLDKGNGTVSKHNLITGYSLLEYRNIYYPPSDWKETIMNIMSLIGTTITVEWLELQIEPEFQERFNWLRDNFEIKPERVTISVNTFVSDCYDESVFDWPTGTEIELTIYNSALPNLERFNTYEKLVVFDFCDMEGMDGSLVTDEILMKMIKLRNISLYYNSNVTINGFHWFVKKWLNQTNDNNDKFVFFMIFNEEYQFNVENVKNMLSDVIGKTEECHVEEYGERQDYWKIEIKKNGEVGGIIKLYSDKIIFESDF